MTSSLFSPIRGLKWMYVNKPSKCFWVEMMVFVNEMRRLVWTDGNDVLSSLNMKLVLIGRNSPTPILCNCTAQLISRELSEVSLEFTNEFSRRIRIHRSGQFLGKRSVIKLLHECITLSQLHHAVIIGLWIYTLLFSLYSFNYLFLHFWKCTGHSHDENIRKKWKNCSLLWKCLSL